MNREHKINDSPRQRTDYAGRCALSVGGMWITACICNINVFHFPILKFAGDTLFLLSVYMIYIMVVRYRAFVTPLKFSESFRMAWRICLFAGLLNILALYLYLRFLDGGNLIESMTEIMSSEQYIELVKKHMPEMEVKQMIALIQNISLREMTLNLWICNILLSLPISLLTGFFASKKDIDKYKRQYR